MNGTAVSARGLTRTFGSVTAVRSLDLTVGEGEMFGLVGPDGAGKTTLIRMLCGILEPTSGRAGVLGLDIETQREAVKPQIGYLSQKFSLYGDLTVDENVEFFAGIHSVAGFRERRDELLEFTRLTPFRKRLAERLSGGMKQKLALACTLIHTPRLLLLDEPTTGVDPVSRRDFWKILSRLLRGGITIVMATPYLDEAERCSRVGLLSGGSLLAVDTPDGLRGLMEGTVIEIVCTETRKAASIAKGVPVIRDVQLFGDRLNIVAGDPESGMSLVEAALRKEGISVIQQRIVPPSLENVFISITRHGTAGKQHE